MGGIGSVPFWYLLSFIPDSQIQPGSYNPMTRSCRTHEREKHTRRSYRETTDLKHYLRGAPTPCILCVHPLLHSFAATMETDKSTCGQDTHNTVEEQELPG